MLKICRFLTRNSCYSSLRLQARFYAVNVPELDYEYLCDKSKLNEISANVRKRKGVGDVNLLQDLKCRLDQLNFHSDDYQALQQSFVEEAKKIPNRTHPEVLGYGEDPKVVKLIGSPRKFDYKPKEFHEITKKLNLARTEQLGNVSGTRSYFFMGELAEMEHALIQFTVSKLLDNGFNLISVPDILHRDVIESCGMNTRGERSQVYTLDPELHGPDLCLSGTSEMAIGGYLSKKKFKAEELPLKLAAVSRCYRAEVSSVSEEKGIYRVHQFTKVEMFGVCKPENSSNMLDEFLSLQENHFSSLGLHMRTLDMPPHELGAPAYRKYDIEAWLPGRKIFGEISSASNCTDYQSRRLSIKYLDGDKELYVHTLNGTACAVPRMLIAILETYQNEDGTINIPDALQKYMGGKTKIQRQKSVPELRLIKNKK